DRPAVRPCQVCDRPDLAAGAFLTVRSLLVAAGADPAAITPSTPLQPSLRRHLGVFLGPVSYLAPGALPTAPVFDPILLAAGLALPVGLVAACPGGQFSLPGGVLTALLAVPLWLLARRLGLAPARVEYGDLHPFRDLARVIAQAQAPSPLQQTS